MRIRRRPPPLFLTPPFQPSADPPSSVSSALYVDLLASPNFPSSPRLSIGPPHDPQITALSDLLQPIQPSPPQFLPLTAPLVHEIQDLGTAADSHRGLLSESTAGYPAGKALEGRCDSTVLVPDRCEDVREPLMPFQSIDWCLAEANDNYEMRMPIRKRRSFTRPRFTKVSHAGPDGKFEEREDKRSAGLEELNQIGTWQAKEFISWALKLIVAKEGSKVLPGRIAKALHPNKSNTDNMPRLVPRRWAELAKKIRGVEDKARFEVFMKGGKRDRSMHDNRHILQKQANKLRSDLNKSVDGKLRKSEICNDQHEDSESRIADSGIELGIKEVPSEFNQEKGSTHCQLERRGRKRNKLRWHRNLQHLAIDAKRKLPIDMRKMKKKKNKN